MSNFDDIFESTPQTDEFDKEAWAAKKKAERDEVYALTDATAEAVCADGGKFREYLDVQAVSHDARALLNALIYKRPAPVQSVDELPNGMNAVYDREQNAVFVRRGLSAIDLFCGLSKALAQAELARTGEEYTEENAGFKAQCVSYILGKEFGVDVSGYAFEAPADFLRTDDPQTIRAELTDIRDTAYDISARMMRSLEQNKAPRQSEQER